VSCYGGNIIFFVEKAETIASNIKKSWRLFIKYEKFFVLFLLCSDNYSYVITYERMRNTD